MDVTVLSIEVFIYCTLYAYAQFCLDFSDIKSKSQQCKLNITVKRLLETFQDISFCWCKTTVMMHDGISEMDLLYM